MIEYIENRITYEAKTIFEEMDAKSDVKLSMEGFDASGRIEDEDLAKAVIETATANS